MIPFRAIVLGCLLLANTVTAQAQQPVRLGWTPWADGIFVTRLAERLIEDELERPVERLQLPISEQYQALASGRIDAMLMSWQPATHRAYLDRIKAHIENLGVLYDGARLGWAVPDYIPADQVASIADLAEHADAFGGEIVGIDPDAGLSRLSQKALRRYDLDGYQLTTSSGPAMAERLSEAAAGEQWIVVTAWNPHWIFAALDLRYLDDPRGLLGESERVHALARPDFYAEHPEVARLLARMYLDLDDLEEALFVASENGYDAAVDRFLAEHRDAVDYWVNGGS